MIKTMLCLYDIKAELYLNPFVCPTMGVAYRMLADEVARRGATDSQIAAHPEDFQLVRLGSFEEETAQIVLCKTPELVLNLRDLVVAAE